MALEGPPDFSPAPGPLVTVDPPQLRQDREPEMVKLFVGQVPKHFDESDLRPYLESYGSIHELSVLRDRITNSHRGCAFVTYDSKDSAEKAQKELHDNMTLPGMSRPLQVKPAGTDGRAEELRKVFVGMLSKNAGEEDVQRMFHRFGPIEEVTVLRDRDGQSKGCAFIKFSSRQQAQQAINEMHGSEIMAGASSPLVVKYADTDRERQARRIQKAMQQFAQLSINPFPVFPGTYASLVYAQLLQQQAAMAAGIMPGQVYSPGGQLLSPSSPTHHHHPGNSPVGTGSAGPPASSGLASPGAIPGISPLSTGLSGLSPNGMGGSSEALHSPLQSPLHGYSGMQGQYGLTYPYNSPFSIQSATASAVQQQQQQQPQQKEGPEGCNLFIYHLPQEYGDQDLYSLFAPYGNIVSAKVFIDKATQQSKCFGFVSYDNPQSASHAILVLNGYQAGPKRLKVEHKKPREPRKPF